MFQTFLPIFKTKLYLADTSITMTPAKVVKVSSDTGFTKTFKLRIQLNHKISIHSGGWGICHLGDSK